MINHFNEHALLTKLDLLKYGPPSFIFETAYQLEDGLVIGTALVSMVWCLKEESGTNAAIILEITCEHEGRCFFKCVSKKDKAEMMTPSAWHNLMSKLFIENEGRFVTPKSTEDRAAAVAVAWTFLYDKNHDSKPL